MKKIIVGLLIALVVVVALAVLAVSLFLDKAIKSGVETFGPKFTKVDVKLQSVSLSLLSGAGTIKGLVVGNPEGFKTPSAISVGEASLALKPGSLLSDKIIIKSIKLQAPEITFETDLRNNNLARFSRTCRRPRPASGRNRPSRRSRRNRRKRSRPRSFRWMSLSSPAARFTWYERCHRLGRGSSGDHLAGHSPPESRHGA